MYFCDFVSMSPEKGMALHLNKLDFPQPKAALF